MITREELQTMTDAEDLVRRSTVPSRKEVGAAARRTHHREDWCISRFVLRQLQAGVYAFPITIERPAQDPPDFLVTIAGGLPVAVEVRDAGEETLQKASTDLSRAPKGTWLEEGKLVAPGGKLTGRGTTANEPEQKWARDVAAAIVDKTAGLPRQPPADRYELLLYDQTHTMADPLEGAKLVTPVPPAPMPTGARAFDRVSVLSDGDLLLDVYGDRRLLQRNKAEPA
jgi:hypothetical protein